MSNRTPAARQAPRYLCETSGQLFRVIRIRARPHPDVGMPAPFAAPVAIGREGCRSAQERPLGKGVPEGLEAVRKRPGTSIGSVGGHGLHHLVFEVAEPALDEILGGTASRVEITLAADGRFSAIPGRGRAPRWRSEPA